MGKIVFESKYEADDVVAFEKDDRGLIGIMKGTMQTMMSFGITSG